MPPYAFANQNVITIYQGSDYFDTVTITKADGAAMDLTGCEVVSVLRDLQGGMAATFVCTMPNPLSGIINRHIVTEETGALTPNPAVCYVWGIQITDTEGYILPEVQGGAKVIAEIV